MPHAMRIHQPGGPESLQWEEITPPEPADDEVLIRQSAVGLNFIDIYYRNGTYRPESYPFIPGFEGVGLVIRPGKNAQYVKVGDRVAYAMGPVGAYAEYRVIPERYLVKIPGGLSNEQVAAIFLRGLTVHFLVRRTYLVGKDTTMLVHAAAGGVGMLLAQWGKYLGATVIGTVGSDAKRELAQTCGCDLVINYRTENTVQKLRDFTAGQGVNVVYDGVGRDTFDASLDSLAHFGTFVSYGQASGPVPPVDLGLLRDKGSLFITRPTLFHYKRDQEEYQLSASELFNMVLGRHLRLHVLQSYKLADAATAHREMEAGQTQGACVLVT